MTRGSSDEGASDARRRRFDLATLHRERKFAFGVRLEMDRACRGSSTISRKKRRKIGAQMTRAAAPEARLEAREGAWVGSRVPRRRKREARSDSGAHVGRKRSACRPSVRARSRRVAKLEDGQVRLALDVANDELELSERGASKRRRGGLRIAARERHARSRFVARQAARRHASVAHFGRCRATEGRVRTMLVVPTCVGSDLGLHARQRQWQEDSPETLRLEAQDHALEHGDGPNRQLHPMRRVQNKLSRSPIRFTRCAGRSTSWSRTCEPGERIACSSSGARACERCLQAGPTWLRRRHSSSLRRVERIFASMIYCDS
jgi:hypothetical protein